MYCIALGTPERAEFVAGLLAANHDVTVDGSTVTLDADALAALAGLPGDHDGHYDGEYVWVGVFEYPVRAAD